MENNNDSKNELIEALSQASRGKNRYKKSRLEEVIDEVEIARASGLSKKEIVAVLAGRGLVMSEGVFSTTRSRILKKREIAPTPAKVEAAAKPPAIQQKQITGDEIKNSLRGPVNLKKYE